MIGGNACVQDGDPEAGTGILLSADARVRPGCGRPDQCRSLVHAQFDGLFFGHIYHARERLNRFRFGFGQA